MGESNYSGFRTMINYIMRYKADVPEELRNGCMVDENGLTVAMYWIRIMEKEIKFLLEKKLNDNVVPKWMIHDPNLRDKEGWTIAMHWIEIYGEAECPSWMRCDGNIQNRKGKTVGMFYLMVRRGEEVETKEGKKKQLVHFPDWMKCRADLFDAYGNGILDYWLEYTNNDIPEWINVDKSFRNGNGESPEMSWLIHRKSLPPEELRETQDHKVNEHYARTLYNKNIKTNYNFTYKDVYQRIFPEMNDSDFEEDVNVFVNEDGEIDDISKYILK